MSLVIDNATRALAQTGTQVQKLLVGLPAAVESLLADIQTNANTIADQESSIAENTKRIEAEVRDQAAEKGTLNTMVIVPEKFSALGAVK